jgi:hypothetical protein
MSEEAKKIAWKAQQRLHKRYAAMSARGKNESQIVAAIGRELIGFVWAIAVATERQQKRCRSCLIEHDDSNAFLDSSADDGGGTTKRRTLLAWSAVSRPRRIDW